MAKGLELLIDGDILIYRAVSAGRTDVDWGDGQLASYCDASEVRQLFDTEVNALKEHVGAKRVKIALSDRGRRWRQAVLPSYKSGRSDVKPLGFWELFEYAQTAYNSEILPGLEGDDVLGLWATKPKAGPSIVFSIDKDLRGVPCNLLREWRGSVEEITTDAADRFHLLQTLMGDRTDGYTGIPGVGEKKAEKILADIPAKNRWDAVVAAYEKAKLTRADALVQAQVARILRHGEYNRVTGAVKRWQP